jgi:electron transfer flavoprotein beta subunit
MKIAVILRNGPDPLEELPIIDGKLDWEEASLALDLFDDYALEEAVLLKEQTGAELVVVGLVSHGVRLLQTALARGADRAVKLDFDVPDDTSSRALAPVFADAVRHLGADIVITGVQGAGDIFGQLGPFLATELDWPQVNGAISIEAVDDRLHVRHDAGAGRVLALGLTLPAVVGVQASRRPPSYVSGSKLRKAIEAGAIETLRLTSAIAPDAAKLHSLQRPQKDRQVERLDDDPQKAAEQIISLLANQGIEGKINA